MQAQTPANNALLTPRELEVLRALASGYSYWQTAMRLGISPHTVVTHVKNAYRKLQVRSAPAAVMRAVQLGLFEHRATRACEASVTHP